MNDFVSVVTPTKRPSKIDNIFENYNRQNYENKELIIILNNNEFNIDVYYKKAQQYKNVKVYMVNTKVSLGLIRNMCIEKSNYEYIAFFDDDDYYGEDYLKNTMDVFEKTNASIVGKTTAFTFFEDSKELGIYNYGKENTNTILVQDATITLKKSDVYGILFPDYSVGTEGAFLRECKKKGLKIYSADKYDYVTIRSKYNDHTWDTTDYIIKIMCKNLKHVNDFREYIKRPNK